MISSRYQLSSNKSWITYDQTILLYSSLLQDKLSSVNFVKFPNSVGKDYRQHL